MRIEGEKQRQIWPEPEQDERGKAAAVGGAGTINQGQVLPMRTQEAAEYVWQRPIHTMGGFTTDEECAP